MSSKPSSSSSSAVPRYAYILVCAEVTTTNLVRQYYLRNDGKLQTVLLTRTEEKAAYEQTFDPLSLVRDPTPDEINMFHFKVVAALNDSLKFQSILRIVCG